MSKTTSKDQTPPPLPPRKRSGSESGDRIDAAFLMLAQEAFAEWNSKADIEAFRDL